MIYEETFGKHYMQRQNRRRHWRRFALPLSSVGLVTFIVPIKYSGLNSIYSLIIALCVTTLILIYFRNDLIWDAIASGVLFGFITLVGFIIFTHLYPGIVEAWWKVENISGIFILGVPLEELLFSFALGAAVGPAYEFFVGLQFKKH